MWIANHVRPLMPLSERRHGGRFKRQAAEPPTVAFTLRRMSAEEYRRWGHLPANGGRDNGAIRVC